jgi:hypothetical protein
MKNYLCLLILYTYLRDELKKSALVMFAVGERHTYLI